MYGRRVGGFTLLEMVIAIVIISVGLAGVLLAFNTSVRSSADPLIHKQMQAVAEEMMEEILLKPYVVSGTAPANSLKSCGGGSPPSRAAFDDVSDYNGYQTSGVCDIDGEVVTGLGEYNVRVIVVGETWQGVANTLHVTVTVSHGGETFALDGWRTGYAS